SEAAKGFSIRRVEVNGGAAPGNTVDLSEGSNITNAKIVMTFGNSTIRGQAILPSPLPSGYTAMAYAVDPHRREEGGPTVQIDTRGVFVFENLSAGEYEVRLMIFPSRPGSGPSYSGKQTVTVAEGAEASVTITAVPNTPNPGGNKP